MQETATVQCPYCGKRCEVEFDPTIASQRFTTECETCCRPFLVHAECQVGEISAIEAVEE
jgi:hypothetical protein